MSESSTLFALSPVLPGAVEALAATFDLFRFELAHARLAGPSPLAAFLIGFDRVKRSGTESKIVAGVLNGDVDPMTLAEHIACSSAIYGQVRAEVEADYDLTAVIGLLSGGDDSSTFVHLFRGEIDYVGHVDTTIGVRATQDHVRAVCEAWDLHLIVVTPPPECHYRNLVLRWGFPGPAGHGLMYTRLKERALRKLRARFVTAPRQQRVMFLGGMRNHESERRMKNTQVTHPDGSIVWCSPIAWWTNDHLREYRELFTVPRNEVSVHLHMSGECLCGAFASPGEIWQIETFAPEVAEYIHDLEREVRAKNAAEGLYLNDTWGTRPAAPCTFPNTGPVGDLCQKCEQGVLL